MKIIDIEIQDIFNEYTPEKNQWVIDNFQMPIPNKVRIHICDSTLAKMKEAIALTSSRKFNKIEFISTTRANIEHCLVELFLNDNIVEIAQHEDFDTHFNSFDKHHFTVLCSSLYSGFQVKFLFHNGTGREFLFKTKYFNIQ